MMETNFSQTFLSILTTIPSQSKHWLNANETVTRMQKMDIFANAKWQYRVAQERSDRMTRRVGRILSAVTPETLRCKYVKVDLRSVYSDTAGVFLCFQTREVKMRGWEDMDMCVWSDIYSQWWNTIHHDMVTSSIQRYQLSIFYCVLWE